MKQDQITYLHGKIVNIYIVYKLTGSTSDGKDPTVKISLIDAVTLTKNADIDKYQYLGYAIVFDERSFSFPGGGFDSNANKFWSRYEFFCSCW